MCQSKWIYIEGRENRKIFLWLPVFSGSQQLGMVIAVEIILRVLTGEVSVRVASQSLSATAMETAALAVVSLVDTTMSLQLSSSSE